MLFQCIDVMNKKRGAYEEWGSLGIKHLNIIRISIVLANEP